MILKCHICTKNILSHCRKLKCKKCCSSAHSKCYDIDDGDITDPNGWLCRCCLSEALPFYHHSDENEFLSALYACINNKPIDITYLNEYNLTPFEWNSKIVLPIDIENPYRLSNCLYRYISIYIGFLATNF